MGDTKLEMYKPEIVITESDNPYHRENGEYKANGYLLYSQHPAEILKPVQDLEVDDNEVLIATYPRSGTTFVQRLVCGLKDGTEAISDSSYDLFQHSPFLDLKDELFLNYHGLEVAHSSPRPRFLKTHLAHGLAPVQFDIKGKVVLVLRNPRDTLVSQWHFHRNDEVLDFSQVTFDQFFDMFISGNSCNGDWFNFVESWWKRSQSKTTKDNMLVMHYENILSNFEEEVRRLAEFLGYQKIISQPGFLQELARVTNVKVMKSTALCKGVTDFVRKGKAGDWKNHFSKEQTEIFDEHFEREMAKRKIGFKFQME